MSLFLKLWISVTKKKNPVAFPRTSSTGENQNRRGIGCNYLSLSLLHGQKVQNGHPRGINVTPRLPRSSMHVNDRHAWHWNGPKMTTPIWWARPRLPGSILHSYGWPFWNTHLNNTRAKWIRTEIRGSVDSARSDADEGHGKLPKGSVRSWRINTSG